MKASLYDMYNVLNYKHSSVLFYSYLIVYIRLFLVLFILKCNLLDLSLRSVLKVTVDLVILMLIRNKWRSNCNL